MTDSLGGPYLYICVAKVSLGEEDRDKGGISKNYRGEDTLEVPPEMNGIRAGGG